MLLRHDVLRALSCYGSFGATAGAITSDLLPEYSGRDRPELSIQAVYLTLGELVSEGLAACDRTTAGVLYQITDSGRAQMLAASAGEMGAI